MSQTVVLKVGMSCEGCVGAVKRVLGKMEGRYCISSYVFDTSCFFFFLILGGPWRDTSLASLYLPRFGCWPCVSLWASIDPVLKREVRSLNQTKHICRSVISGVESYEVDLKEQKVTVKGQVQPDAVLQTVSKTGKKTTFWDA
ncbi:copper transport protein ATX1 [Gossypium australe]|uniref:Copper transport protein ATX1 n=1 Tax=Gossypium australe TaxID=47621 RepID=A0A5B6VC04_9ROSI|nr:copper transport protein ATX1 [Gossypium australe]